MEYLHLNQLLHPNSHAYRRGHNTTTALISMYDSWTQSVDAGLSTGAIVLDMSAAFDIIDRQLLLKKLSLIGFEDDVVGWLNSYLSNRSQSVCVNGVQSKLLPTDTGVPQGSILGPLLYTLYTLEVPEVIHEYSDKDENSIKWPPYHTSNKNFDNIVVYADDTTVNLTAANDSELSLKLETNFKKVSEFMVSQGLKLNDDKSHLLVFSNSRSKAETGSEVILRTPLGDIRPSESEKFLGGIVQRDLKWTGHIISDRDNLVSALNKRCNALKLITRVASFKTRKAIANGMFMGKLIYLISVWGGTTKCNLDALQCIQNRAARLVTRNWKAGTAENLNVIGWLSVNQLVFYHSVTLMFKLKLSRSVGSPSVPQYLTSMFNWNYDYNTRQATGEKIKPKGNPKLEATRKGFRYRAAESLNQLPEQITKANNVKAFKLKAKTWIKHNVNVRA